MREGAAEPARPADPHHRSQQQKRPRALPWQSFLRTAPGAANGSIDEVAPSIARVDPPLSLLLVCDRCFNNAFPATAACVQPITTRSKSSAHSSERSSEPGLTLLQLPALPSAMVPSSHPWKGIPRGIGSKSRTGRSTRISAVGALTVGVLPAPFATTGGASA